MPDTLPQGRTPREVARLLRVSPEKVRGWIQAGLLGAVNTATVRCGKPRFVILPEHLAAFEAAQRVSPPPKPAPRRRRRADLVDYLEDV